MISPSALQATSRLQAVKPTVYRQYEVAALRADGSRWIWQKQAAATPLLDSAFAAFGRGILLSGVDGPIAVEDLQPGDMLKTVSGEPAPVVWIGSTTFVPANSGVRTPLIRVMADSFGISRPTSFLTLGPAARILQTLPHIRAANGGLETLTPAGAFVDNVNVIRIHPPTPVRLFHFCLSRHAAVDVGGVAVETFHPGMRALRAMSHHEREDFLDLFPHIHHSSDFGPLANPRALERDHTTHAA